MAFSHWLSLFSICLLGAMSPGPSLAVVVENSLRGGRGAGVATALGHGLGVTLYAVLTVTGLALLITGNPTLFRGLQALGALYLIYLGVSSLRSNPGARAAAAEPETGRQRAAAASGFLVAFLNPKLAVFMLALFAQFMDPEGGAVHQGIMVMTVGTTDALWYCLVAILLSWRVFHRRLLASKGVIDRLFGVILVALGGAVLLRAIA